MSMEDIQMARHPLAEAKDIYNTGLATEERGSRTQNDLILVIKK